MTYQYFHSPYEQFDVMFIYSTNTFLNCILDISRDPGIHHQMYPSTYHPWCKSVLSPVLLSSRFQIYILKKKRSKNDQDRRDNLFNCVLIVIVIGIGIAINFSRLTNALD